MNWRVMNFAVKNFRVVIAGGLGLAALIMTGCSSTEAAQARNPAPCPNVIVLDEAARLIDFDGEQKLEDIAFTGEITDVTLNCRYFEDKPIDAVVEIDFALGRGPNGQAPTRDYRYFVAVTRTNLEVIAKQEFLVRAEFGDKRDVVQLREKIDKLVIPRKSAKTSGTNFEIVVGFVLDRDQVIFNRSGKSLKFPSL